MTVLTAYREYGSYTSHVTSIYSIQKHFVLPVAVSRVKKLMVYGSLDVPGQIYTWGTILLLMNPRLITLSSTCSCSDNVA